MKMSLYTALMLTTALTHSAFNTIKLEYKDETEIPAEYKGLYTEKDGVWNLTGIEGIKTQKDVNAVSEALRKERNDHRLLRESLRNKFGEQYNLDEIRASLDETAELRAQIEAGDLKDPKKLEGLVTAKANALKAPLERQLAEIQKKYADLEKENSSFKGEKKTRTIHDAIREAGAKVKILPGAIDDALMLAERHFEINEEGNVVTSESHSSPGILPADWFAELQEKKPHWWGTSSGGGAGGNLGGHQGKNPWSAEHWNLTQQGQIASTNPTRASALASAAGTVVGGRRPVPGK